MTVGVLCALRGPAEAEVVRALATAGRTVEVTRRCADVTELLACAAAGLGQVVVVSVDLPGADREAVRQLHAAGALVVGVGAHADADRLGCDAAVPAPTAAAEVIAVVTGLLEGAPGPSAPGPSGTRPGERAAVEASAPLTPAPVPVDRHGRLVAVWGPTGAPGRTTLAVNLAAELGRLAVEQHVGDVLLVDADTYGGTVAQTLGLLDEASGIAAATRAATAGRLDPDALAGLARGVLPGLRVLSGIGRPDRWPELTPAGLEALWACARRTVPWTVVDCGFSVEQDEALTYDTRAPRRNASTLGALAEADLVVVVGAGDPVGLQRLVRALGDLDDLGVPASVRRVVVNRVRASACGPRPADAVAHALLRYAGVDDVRVVPHDGPACDGALLAARTLAEHAPTSPARRAIAALAKEVLGAVPVVTAH